MSKSIYEEALESAKQHQEVTDMSLEIKALEYAQKQEKLLELYKKRDEVSVKMILFTNSLDYEFMEYASERSILSKQIGELENK